MVLLGAISVAAASRRLSLSYRQTWTLYDRFRAAGGSLDARRFQRRHAAPNRTPDELRQGELIEEYELRRPTCRGCRPRSAAPSAPPGRKWPVCRIVTTGSGSPR
jgi:hypothetical protein